LGTKKSGEVSSTMKTLFIGHYTEHSGWSDAALNCIKALNTTDMDIVCRNLKLTDTNTKLDNDILNLENKSLDNVDYCIQNVLPHHITGTNKFKKNVAYIVHELDSIKDHAWQHNLSLVDEVWVPNTDLKTKLLNDGLQTEVKVIPYAFDMSKYQDNLHRVLFENNNHTFKFYFICDVDDRKNLESIIRCFHSEFHASEPVSLVLKLKRNGMDAKSLRDSMIKFCDNIKTQMRLYKNISEYNHEIIITDDFTNEQMKILHQTCDCYVGPTHGEGWGMPAFDAMCFGKTPICSKEGGPKDFIDPNNRNTGWLVNGMLGICNHRNAAFPDIFTGRHHWFIPNELEVKAAMRYYYENRSSKNVDGLERGRKFSYTNIGQMIKETLNG
jgi:Glycosyl transferases group 1